MKPFRIAIAGIGGVGGYFGGKLAAYYESRPDEVEVSFIARGANEAAIRAQGLRVESQGREWVARPARLVSNPAELGPVDLVLCCTKGYDLESSLEQLQPCLGPDTVVLPLLNGVDSYERIKRLLPAQEVWDGCVYIVARLAGPGLVRDTGNIRSLYFGSRQGPSPRQTQVEQLLQAAGIEARLEPGILSRIWQKFVFISPVATLTSAFDNSLGAVLTGAESRPLVDELLVEVMQLAEGLGISLPADIRTRTLGTMASMPYATVSSMLNDFRAGKNTELESLTGYVVHRSRELDLPCPAYERLYAQLLARPNLLLPLE
jgi:2-dehydropantoate 2-reductase